MSILNDIFYVSHNRQLLAPAPRSQQPNVDRVRSEVSEAELPLYDQFLNEQFVATLFEFSALEEDKSQDKFRLHMMKFYKV